jgi:sporulation protein YlmC with PRC-barrel domain
MNPGTEIITSDGKRIGHVGPPSRADVFQVARSSHTIPWSWVARADTEVILRKTYDQVLEAWSAEAGGRENVVELDAALREGRGKTAA